MPLTRPPQPEENTVRTLFLNMTMSLDGYVAGPNGELDWMTTAHDAELTADIVAQLRRADEGFIGYPTAEPMIRYWATRGDRRRLAGWLRYIAGHWGVPPRLRSRPYGVVRRRPGRRLGKIVASEQPRSNHYPKTDTGRSRWNRERPGQDGYAARDLNPEPAD
jgi:hypothetical protein